MHVLVIDDEPAVRQILSLTVKKAGHTCDTAATIAEATSRLVRGDVDVALCDIHLPDGSGLDMVQGFRDSGLDTQFLMVTAFASVETAVQAIKCGATDYIIKPVNSDELSYKLNQIDAIRGLKDENRALKRLVGHAPGHVYSFESPQMLEVGRLISRVAVTDSTVLITGESGTGKGVLARRLHETSARGNGIFLPVNCGAIPENLLESEFFGHVKGAFTGADKLRKGLFLQADRGTLFLDEIGELPLHMQAKLLHSIEDKEVRPVGSEQARKVNVRIVAATNRNLEDAVKEGRFREDLYFRLGMFHIHIPPLRERSMDIRGLIRFFLDNLQRDSGKSLEFDAETEDILLHYAWPGNVRQLENVVNRAFILADGDYISPTDLPREVVRRPDRSPDTPAPSATDSGDLREQMRRFEAAVIAGALKETSGDRRQAAERLGIGLSSLYRKIDELSEYGLIK